MEKRLRAIARVSFILGLLGVADEIYAYAVGTHLPYLPSIAFTLDFAWGKFYVDLFILGVFTGFGLRSRDEIYRVVGLVSAVLWAIGAILVITASLTPFAAEQVGWFVRFSTVVLMVALFAYSIWQFRVLHSAEVRAAFGRGDDVGEPLPDWMKSPTERSAATERPTEGQETDA